MSLQVRQSKSAAEAQHRVACVCVCVCVCVCACVCVCLCVVVDAQEADRAGALAVERCNALGVRPGRNYTRLKDGHHVMVSSCMRVPTAPVHTFSPVLYSSHAAMHLCSARPMHIGDAEPTDWLYVWKSMCNTCHYRAHERHLGLGQHTCVYPLRLCRHLAYLLVAAMVVPLSCADLRRHTAFILTAVVYCALCVCSQRTGA